MDERALLTTHWPLFGLVVRTPRVELRYPTDADLAELATMSADIHDPDDMPFRMAWSTRPDAERRRGTFQWHWGNRARWTASEWTLDFATVVDGEVVGSQGVNASAFPVTRVVETGSWLARRHQGTGIGTEMREAILHLAFAGLGALRATTGAFDDNPSSLGVTRKLGYRPNGEAVHDVEGSRRIELTFVLDRADWEARRRADIEIDGLDPCLPLFALDPPSS
jgi:RimJ/RimL family protein N-acetyltransferase